MFKDFIATLVTTIIAVSGTVADSTGQLTEKLGDVLAPVTTTSISYARVPARPVHALTGIVRGESTTTPSTSTVITQPVIERIIETVRTVGPNGMSSADLDARLAAFAYDFTNRLRLSSNTSLRQDEILSDSIGETFAGDLSGLTIAASSWTGGTITDATITGGSLANYLPLTGGTLTGDLTMSGTLTAGALSVAGISSSGALVGPYVTATSTTATSTFAGGITGANSFTVQSSSGNVGIGTASPTSKLYIVQSADTSTSGIALVNSTLSASFRAWIDGSDIGRLDANSSGNNNIALNGSGIGKVGVGLLAPGSRLSVNGGVSVGATYSNLTAPTNGLIVEGNIGIGNASPTYKLDVTGLGRFTGLVDAANFVATSTTATTTLAGGLAVETSGLVYDYSTNRVGIGTAAPKTSLDVRGNLYLSDASKLILGGHATEPLEDYQSIAGDSSGNNLTFRTYADYLFQTVTSNGSAGGTIVTLKQSGNVGIATTTPWRKLSVTGTVGFDGLTGSTGAGSLCLDSNKQVVYNSASDNCLSSTRATKHDINPLLVDTLSQVLALQPVSFIYNEGDGRTRFGFIAVDTGAIDPHLVTYDASSTVSGIDDRSIIAILVGAIKDLWAKVAALMQSDEAQTARIQKLEEEVAALKMQTAAGAPSVGTSEAPGDPSASGGSPDTDTATSTTPSDAGSTPQAANDNQPITDRAEEPQGDIEPVPIPAPANDNPPPSELPATGTE